MTDAFRPLWTGASPAFPGAAPAAPALDGVAVGCDVVEVARIAQLLARRPSARDTLFTATEQAEAVRDGIAPDHDVAVRRLAARFAAKEALVKLLGRPALAWTDVEVRTGEDGAPRIHLHGEATDIAVSLSHDRGVAMAVVAHTASTRATSTRTTTSTTH